MRTRWRVGWVAAVALLSTFVSKFGPAAAGAEPPASPPAAPEPDGSFLGDLSGSKKVVFVIDFSGSMLNRIWAVKRETMAAIEKLQPAVSFDVIAFDRDAKAWNEKLVPADDTHKREAYKFLDDTMPSNIDFRGTFTDPWPGLRAALRLEPDRICLVTDGDFPREDDFAAKVCRLVGPKPAVRVDCLAWVHSPTDVKPFVSLRLISHHTGGKFLCVTEPAAGELSYHQFEESNLPHAKPGESGSGDAMTRVELAGLTSPAAAVAFLYDTSMDDSLRQQAEAEISRTLGRMDKRERFSVIGFGDRGGPASYSPTLVLAVPDNVRSVAGWLDSGKALVPSVGAKEPAAAAALDLAVRQHADAIYLLYGPETDLQEVRAKLAELNKAKPSPVRAYLVAVVGERPKARQTVKAKIDDVEFALPVGTPDPASALPRAIAEENAGTFDYLGPADGAAAPATRPAAKPEGPARSPVAAKPRPRPARTPEPVEELGAPAGEPASPSVFDDLADPKALDRVMFLCGPFKLTPQKGDGPRSELRKAVLGLKPEQAFDLVFVSDRDALCAFPGGVMVSASRENKRSAVRFADNVTFPDDPDPLPALEKAFAANPTTLFLFTDGTLPKADKVAQRVAELNPAGTVKVNAVVLQGGRAEDPRCVDILKRIAASNGGKYRHVTEMELEKGLEKAGEPVPKR